jgi:mannose-1-phosphate guanylyltransferase/phosphomannomutase
VREGVKVFPFRRISRGAIVTMSLVRESPAPERLFAGSRVEGVLNVDLTPELAIRVAMAFGSAMDPASRVAVSRDPGRGARAIKRAVIAGLTAVGVSCEDLEVAPLSAARYFTFSSGASGGISVRTKPGDPHTVRLFFFDGAGREIPETLRRQVERIFFREGFRRALPHELGDVRLARWVQPYVEALVSWLPPGDGNRRRVVLDAGHGSVALVLPLYLGELRTESLVLGGELDPRLFSEAESDLPGRLERVGELVRTSGAALGAVLEEGGEGLLLLDDAGLPVPAERALLLLIRMLPKGEAGRVVVPFSATSLVEEVAGERGLAVVRTPMDPSRLLAEATGPDCLLVSDGQGRYGFPRFFPGFDAFLALGVLVRGLEPGQGLSELLEGLPYPEVLTSTVHVSWEAKGKIMRLLLQAAEGGRVEVTDGIKITTPEGWVLAAPDPTRALIRLWAEGKDPGAAEKLISEYGQLVRRLAGEE